MFCVSRETVWYAMASGSLLLGLVVGTILGALLVSLWRGMRSVQP